METIDLLSFFGIFILIFIFVAVLKLAKRGLASLKDSSKPKDTKERSVYYIVGRKKSKSQNARYKAVRSDRRQS